MKRIIIVSFSLFLFASCTTQKPLYTWGKYETASYNYLKNSDEKSTQELIASYQKIIEKQNGSRGVVPPGIYADYGFVLLQANRTKEGKAMLLKEVALYPESKVFIDRILTLLDK
ncbi:DUF4810 domain-containing protein [Williamwhitmania taraxaci]|uniref:DUF4810 domain-containing protein n=1 Tax=Williamwhitmania taraxaci TaxID=1640674 RepID=A0A1G6S2D4_9BACT|nr:DUF4810 domain-containing protein [Williamwhitmania taraxaci]SDD10841.1 hypothetical protein SAMN05216323_108514 [Williamwhitmania taraxaci]